MHQLTYSFAPAAGLTKAGAWLLPWLTVLMAASGLAYAADIGLVRAWPEPPPREAMPPSDLARAHWVVIDVSTEQGHTYQVRCLARPKFFASDAVALDRNEFLDISAQACAQLEIFHGG
jgi:hypothetical protein